VKRLPCRQQRKGGEDAPHQSRADATTRGGVGIVGSGDVCRSRAKRHGWSGGAKTRWKISGDYHLDFSQHGDYLGRWRVDFNNQVYKFTLEAKTFTESRVLSNLAGQQIAVEGLVYNLKQVKDFPGTFTHIKPEVVKAMGGTGRNPAFHNEQGVAVVVTKRAKMDYGLYVSLVGDSFKVTLKDF
jgi:hypothetical protein